MLRESFMFTVGMLADLTGGNRQYLSKKIKKMLEDPEIKLQAELKSNKEGYQIPESEVLRCFDQITPAQLQKYKEEYLSMDSRPRLKMLTQKEEEPMEKYLEKENEVLIEWKVRLAATKPEEKNTPKMRNYLEEEMEKIKALKKEKFKEYLMLELFLDNCDKMIEQIQKRLDTIDTKEE